MNLNTDPNRRLRTVSTYVKVMPTPRDAGVCTEHRHVIHFPFFYFVSLRGDGVQDAREPIDSRQFNSLEEWRENIYQMAVDNVEYLLRTAPFHTHERTDV